MRDEMDEFHEKAGAIIRKSMVWYLAFVVVLGAILTLLFIGAVWAVNRIVSDDKTDDQIHHETDRRHE